MTDSNYFLKVDKGVIRAFDGDLELALWYSALKDYRRRFRPDKYGFVRLDKGMITEELGEKLYDRKIRRLNQKLEEMGYIAVDKVKRGARNYMGIKVIK